MISTPVIEAEALVTGATDTRGGRKPQDSVRGAETGAATDGRTKSEDDSLMARVVDRANMRLAYRRVMRNKGSAGVDGLSVEDLGDWLKMHWPSVKQALLEGTYIPRAVRRVDIPKPTGGVRTLGSHRDKEGTIDLKHGNTKNKNLAKPIPGFCPDTTLKTMRDKTGKTS